MGCGHPVEFGVKLKRWFGCGPMSTYHQDKFPTQKPSGAGDEKSRRTSMRPSTGTTVIRFDFSPTKSLQAMGYLVGRLGGIDKVALTKLLYIADRDHFLSSGYPITGDRQYAMPRGPVPSDSLSLLNGEFWDSNNHDVGDYFEQNRYRLTVTQDPGICQLTQPEVTTLNEVLEKYGDLAKKTWLLVKATHEFPEYKEVYHEKTSTLIPYELILKHYDNGSRMLDNRPVVSHETASRMVNPFWGSDSDL